MSQYLPLRFILVAMLLSACATDRIHVPEHWSLQEHSKTICEIMEQPDLYLGHRIVVRANAFNTPHERLVYDDACPKWKFEVHLRRYSRRTEPKQREPVLWWGIFTSQAIIIGCKELDCYRYVLQDARRLPPSPASGLPR